MRKTSSAVRNPSFFLSAVNASEDSMGRSGSTSPWQAKCTARAQRFSQRPRPALLKEPEEIVHLVREHGRPHAHVEEPHERVSSTCALALRQSSSQAGDAFHTLTREAYRLCKLVLSEVDVRPSPCQARLRASGQRRLQESIGFLKRFSRLGVLAQVRPYGADVAERRGDGGLALRSAQDHQRLGVAPCRFLRVAAPGLEFADAEQHVGGATLALERPSKACIDGADAQAHGCVVARAIERPKGCKRVLQEPECLLRVSSCGVFLPEIAQRLGDLEARTELPEDRQRPLEVPQCRLVVPQAGLQQAARAQRPYESHLVAHGAIRRAGLIAQPKRLWVVADRAMNLAELSQARRTVTRAAGLAKRPQALVEQCQCCAVVAFVPKGCGPLARCYRREHVRGSAAQLRLFGEECARLRAALRCSRRIAAELEAPRLARHGCGCARRSPAVPPLRHPRPTPFATAPQTGQLRWLPAQRARGAPQADRAGRRHTQAVSVRLWSARKPVRPRRNSSPRRTHRMHRAHRPRANGQDRPAAPEWPSRRSRAP